jgi:hypothetical protein
MLSYTYVYVYVFSLHRESPSMILEDKRLHLCYYIYYKGLNPYDRTALMKAINECKSQYICSWQDVITDKHAPMLMKEVFF